jgi:hypothetical protein
VKEARDRQVISAKSNQIKGLINKISVVAAVFFSTARQLSPSQESQISPECVPRRILFGLTLPRSIISRSSSRARRAPESEVSATSAKHRVVINDGKDAEAAACL